MKMLPILNMFVVLEKIFKSNTPYVLIQVQECQILYPHFDHHFWAQPNDKLCVQFLPQNVGMFRFIEQSIYNKILGIQIATKLPDHNFHCQI